MNLRQNENENVYDSCSSLKKKKRKFNSSFENDENTSSAETVQKSRISLENDNKTKKLKSETSSFTLNQKNNENNNDSFLNKLSSEETRSGVRKKKKKKKLNPNTVDETVVLPVNQCVQAVESNCKTESESHDESNPKKKKRKKNKLDGNISVSKKENKQTLKSPKKKKRKKKKKQNQVDITKLKGDESITTIQKSSLKKSVTFNENVEVNVIQSQSTSPEENTQNDDRKKEKAIAYLKRWKDDKINWKFEKLTQTWLVKNMYREIMVPSETFTILLEYLMNMKGASRDLVINMSEKIITQMENKASEEKDSDLETAYNRARSILQFVQ